MESPFSFVKTIINKGLKFSISGGSDRETKLDFIGPNVESVHATVNTFRLFVQDSDGISLRAISKNHLDDPDLSEEWKNEFSRVRKEINEYLDGPIGKFRVVLNNVPISTRREVLDIFMYGDVSHLRHNGDEQKRDTFERWRSNQFIYGPLWFSFIDTLSEMLLAITYISNLSKKELNIESNAMHFLQRV